MSVSGHRFSFLCNAEQEEKILRVITYADGKIVTRQPVPEGILLTVQKT